MMMMIRTKVCLTAAMVQFLIWGAAVAIVILRGTSSSLVLTLVLVIVAGIFVCRFIDILWSIPEKNNPLKGTRFYFTQPAAARYFFKVFGCPRR